MQPRQAPHRQLPHKFARWLRGEIELWLGEGIINAEQAARLSGRYPLQPLSGSWGKVIFSAIGAIIFGLGVILLFAYNWQAMHRLLKLALVFGAVIGAHGAGFYLYFYRGDRDKKIGESLLLLGTMLYGAGIFLVAQIYHIDSHYPNGILIWSLGALALAWTLFSTSQALLALLLLAMWQWFEAFDFNRAVEWMHWLIALGTIPLAWLKRSQVLLFFSTVLFLLLFFISSAVINEDLSVIGLFMLAVAALNLAKVLPASNYPESSGIFAGIGTVLYVLLLFSVCFVEVIDSLTIKWNTPLDATFYLGIPVLGAAGTYAMLLTKFRHAINTGYDRIDVILQAVSVTSILFAALTSDRADGFVVVIFNILFFASACVFLVRGMHEVSWKQVSLGCAMAAAIVFARFMDLFDSLLLRSMAFLIIGAALFFTGLYFSRQKAKQSS